MFMLWTLSAAWALGAEGVVEGRVVNKTDPARVPAKVEVEVMNLTGGMSVIKSAVTDAAGRFRIDGLPTQAPLMLRANYDSVNYHQPLSFDASGKAQPEIDVFESTRSMNDVRLQEVRIAFQMAGESLRCLQSYSFENRTQPPRTVIPPDGTFRFAKAPGILEMPRMSVLGPGATMPLTDSALESADGQSYYSLYPLRPGVTTFEVEQSLPYVDRTYTYRGKFYNDIPGLNIGVIPRDMTVAGDGLARTQTDAQRNFAVYAAGALKAGTEVTWTLTGGTPVAAAPEAQPAGESRITPMPTSVGQNALVLGPLLLIGFIVVLWYSLNLAPAPAAGDQDPRAKALRERREQLISFLAALDHRFESNSVDQKEYARLREQGKSQLRRIAALLGKK
jgi:hypothetical protein